MLENYLFGKTYQILSTMLDYRSERHKLITSNVVNIDTPDYTPRDLVFKDELKAALEAQRLRKSISRTDKRHLPAATMKVDLDQAEVVTTGDKVNLDREMVNLAENQLMQNLTVELLARKFRGWHGFFTEVK